MAARAERRSFWTWGYVSDEPTEAQRTEAARQVSARLGREVQVPPIPAIEDIVLDDSRIEIPSRLSGFVRVDRADRLTHTYGGHRTELLAALRGEFRNPPDAVAHPRTDAELESVLEWCDANRYTVVPYGGGTSVVWGVKVPDATDGAVTIDLDNLNAVCEIDEVSRAGKFQAGILGPDLEATLRPRGLTLRHFPQSFPWSTVGGWVATRSGGHYATNHTHIDDFVESTRMLTPAGWMETRRLPGSGAGPSPDRLVIGSEGALGIITECWLRLQKRPTFRANAGVRFSDWHTGCEAVRAIVQAKLWPANLRILDPAEASANAGLDGDTALLIIGFESADIPQGEYLKHAATIARDHGGLVEDDELAIDDGNRQASRRGGAVGAWRNAFIGVNAGLTNGLGLMSDTFETAITWDRWQEFDATVRARMRRVLDEVLGDGAFLSCRFTHVYPDGPAPYYTFNGAAQPGAENEQWQTIKDEALAAVVDAGGTVTHHHAVGRMHRPAWDRQRPELFGEALKAVKRRLDPNGILNPGVLVDTS